MEASSSSTFSVLIGVLLCSPEDFNFNDPVGIEEEKMV